MGIGAMPYAALVRVHPVIAHQILRLAFLEGFFVTVIGHCIAIDVPKNRLLLFFGDVEISLLSGNSVRHGIGDVAWHEFSSSGFKWGCRHLERINRRRRGRAVDWG